VKKSHRRWFFISLAHPLLSATGIVLGSTISGWLGYTTGLLAFLANLPGVVLIKQFYRSTPSESAAAKFLVYFSMIGIGITWLFVVVPACFLVSRFLSNRAGR